MPYALRTLSLSALSLPLAWSAWAQPLQDRSPDLQAQVWAASCMACHGTDGKAGGTGLNLQGRSASELYEVLLDYRNGGRTGTIMQKHAKGYTESELLRIAKVFGSTR
jgi:cytochrome c553